MPEESEILASLSQAVIDCDADSAARWAQIAVGAQVDPLLALDALDGGIREIGDGFARGELYLPDLLMSADAMTAASAILEEQIQQRGAARPSAGKVVIGTVFGDIHNIGKNMVATLLKAAGFEVLDLGINVRSEEFVSAVKTFDPGILAMAVADHDGSGTATGHRRGRAGRAARPGASYRGRWGDQRRFARTIGADGFDSTAPGGGQLALELLKKEPAHG